MQNGAESVFVAEEIDVPLFVFPIMSEVVGVEAKFFQGGASQNCFSFGVVLFEDAAIGFKRSIDIVEEFFLLFAKLVGVCRLAMAIAVNFIGSAGYRGLAVGA